MSDATLIAVDLGAESGRVVRGILADGRLALDEIDRFSNGLTERDGHLRWDWPRLLAAIDGALTRAGAADGIGVDSWGVDFGLVDEDERLVGWPVAYRDARTEGVMERLLSRVPAEIVYSRTGIQFLPFNTLYQLAAMAEAGDPALERARRLQLIPDLVLHHLSGFRGTERTNASTTQCLHAAAGDWDLDLIAAAGVDRALFPEIIEPGTIVGARGPIPVIAPATHDTASAVVATPGEGDDWAYLSSGTWSLVGVETDAPVATEEARDLGLTNEAGIEGTTRLLRNLMGLWLVQRCRAALAPEMPYDELTRQAAAAPALRSLVDVDDRRFLNPPSMPDAIAEVCRETGEPVPEGPGDYVRCALESLALATRSVLDALERVLGRPIRRLHVVGGGARNALLGQMTADAIARPVLAGPVEATAAGNVLVQAMALGHLASRHEARRLVRRSFELTTYEPQDTDRWEEAARRLRERT